jgi:thymidylate kinase
MQTRQNTLIKSKFLAIDGLDGSGKATCSKEIAKFLSLKGINVLIADLPHYSTPYGRVLTHLLTENDESLSLKERMCVYTLNRLETVDTILKDITRLEKNEQPVHVIFDRYSTSNVITFAYYLLKEKRSYKISEFKEIYNYMLKIESDFQKLLGNIRNSTNVYILEIKIEETMKRLLADKKRSSIQLYEKEEIQKLSNELFQHLSKIDDKVKIISQYASGQHLQKEEVATKIIRKEFPALLKKEDAKIKGRIKQLKVSPSPVLSDEIKMAMKKLFSEFSPSHLEKLQKIAK